MKIGNSVRDDIIFKNDKLNLVKDILKKEFVGLDEIIDEICNLIEPWYLFPNAQIRPTIINLWGLTSTGKTSLIIRLFELLDINTLLRFDTGEWLDKTDFELKYKISSQLKKISKDNMIPIFVFDEFQLGRTLDDMGEEIDRTTLRVVWDLLDSGKFQIFEDRWEISNLIKILIKLNYLYHKENVEVVKGIIIKNNKAWDLMFAEDKNENDESIETMIKYPKNAFVPASSIWNIKALREDFLSDNQLIEYLLTLNGLETIKFIEETIEIGSKPSEYDFSNSLIFVIGNLDDAYFDSNQISADYDADALYEITKEIKITDIKQALISLYRPEQISRLGNNHVIYRSFNKATYKELIILELNKVVKKIKEKFDINIHFDMSINDIIYNEGVCPTQGVRPIFSTIISLIESFISKIIVDSLKNKFNIIDIYWSYFDEKYIIKLKNDNDEYMLEYPVLLKVENFRKSLADDIQAFIAVHESGHIITSILTTKICPKLALSRTANNDGGFTEIEYPLFNTRELLINQIKILSAGHVAEKLIFGKDNLTSGSYSDIQKLTSIALKVIKEYGMNDYPIQYSSSDFRISDQYICLNDDNLDKRVQRLIRECVDITTKLLTENMNLLLDMSNYLTENSRIEENEIKEIVKKYIDVEYKTKDNYYNYKNILKSKMNR